MSLGFGFILKKMLSALLMPTSIGLILGLTGLWYLHKNSIKRAKRFFTIGLVWMVIVSSMPFANLIIVPLERGYKRLKTIPKDVKHILLLGGDKESRSWEVLRLYQQIPDAKVITSGYPSVSSSSGAVATAKFLSRVGVKRDDISMLTKAKDTEEEVLAIKKMLKGRPFIVVTSAYQMPRAMLIFKKHGLNPIPAPTDFKARSGLDIFLHNPKGRYLFITERAWHEYIGLLWFKIKSY
jgi:uncharacterized SAM-binding protein YcdF (DUF218 family)